MEIEQILGKELKEKSAKIAVAESCTGGLLANRITDVSGSSLYFIGSVVAYSNQVKKDILGVKKDTLSNCGAVSSEVSKEMARGILELLKVDLAVSTTGIAGPTGGTMDKPVGLVYIGLADNQGNLQSFKKQWDGNRLENKENTADKAMRIVLEHISSISD